MHHGGAIGWSAEGRFECSATCRDMCSVASGDRVQCCAPVEQE